MKCSKCGRKSSDDLCPPCLKTLDLEGKRMGKKIMDEAIRKRRESFDGKTKPRNRRNTFSGKMPWEKVKEKH